MILTMPMTLFDDASMEKKLMFMDKLEAMCDDERNEVSDEWDEFIDNIPLGATVQFTMEVLDKQVSSML